VRRWEGVRITGEWALQQHLSRGFGGVGGKDYVEPMSLQQ
jgi:hypothetical protein